MGLSDVFGLLSKGRTPPFDLVQWIRKHSFDNQGHVQIRMGPNRHYITWHGTVKGSGVNTWSNPVHIDVGALLAAKYKVANRVEGVAGYIATDANIQLSFNGCYPNQDEIRWDINWGKVFELKLGDLRVLDIYIANNIPSGTAPDASVAIFISG